MSPSVRNQKELFSIDNKRVSEYKDNKTYFDRRDQAFVPVLIGPPRADVKYSKVDIIYPKKDLIYPQGDLIHPEERFICPQVDVRPSRVVFSNVKPPSHYDFAFWIESMNVLNKKENTLRFGYRSIENDRKLYEFGFERTPSNEDLFLSQAEIKEMISKEDDKLIERKIYEDGEEEHPSLGKIKQTIVEKLPFGKIKISNTKITKPPFSWLLQISNILPNKWGDDMRQNVSDMRIEYYEALAKKNIWRARCIAGLYYAGLSWTAVRWIAGRVKELIGFMPKVD